jgi:hypothetical protein
MTTAKTLIEKGYTGRNYAHHVIFSLALGQNTLAYFRETKSDRSGMLSILMKS